MKRPKSVTILGKKIKITYLKDEPLKDTSALFDPRCMEIQIQEAVEYESDLLHEVLHAALFVSGTTKLLTEEEEETIVTSLEHALFGLYSRDF